MLDLSTAVLCDFAQVRDRLLFVSSGAVSRLYRQELPSPLGLMVGLVIEVPLEDAGMDHQLRAEVINRHGTVLATLENTFRVSDAGLFPHEVQQVPLVLSITGVRARTWGTHQVRLYLDNDLVRALTLYVVPAAGPQATVRATPTQSRADDAEGSLAGGGNGEAAPTPDDERTQDPSPATPFGADEPDTQDDSSRLVHDAPLADLDAPIVVDAPGTSFDPAPSPRPQAVPAAAPPEPHEALDWGDPVPAPAPPAPAPQPADPGRPPTIDAPRADDPADVAPPRTPVFDFEDESTAPAPEPEARPEPDPRGDGSRFSFRYLVDDDG